MLVDTLFTTNIILMIRNSNYKIEIIDNFGKQTKRRTKMEIVLILGVIGWAVYSYIKERKEG